VSATLKARREEERKAYGSMFSGRSTLKPVDTAAALASGSTTWPPLSQPWARALPLFLGSGPSPVAASHQSPSAPPKAADRRPNPLTGMYREEELRERRKLEEERQARERERQAEARREI
jgi:hypothetical protein